MKLQNKVAVVIGGTSGIGQALARGFLREGAKVVATSSNPEKVAAMAEEVKQFHAPLARAVDTRDSAQLAALFAEARSTYGSLDVVVNCAGIHLKKPSVEVADEQWKQVIDINLNGLFFSCREAGKIMIEQHSGSIVNVASLGSFVALTDAAAYCASKAAVVALTKNLAVEWATMGVRVNAIVPGVFQTALNAKALSDPARRETILRNTPMKRFGNVDELVGGAVYLASDAASFTTGSTLVMDGGFLALGI
jgi:NAD(P)-dependent dehydrogenase (short-subunit alcohol dehydrogenase family)